MRNLHKILNWLQHKLYPLINPYFDSLTPNCLKSDKYGFKGHPEQYVVRRAGDQSLE